MASEVVSSSNHHPVAVIIDLSYNNCLSTSASALHTASALVDVPPTQRFSSFIDPWTDGTAKIIHPIGPIRLVEWAKRLQEFLTSLQKASFFQKSKKSAEGLYPSNEMRSVLERCARVSEATRKGQGVDLQWRVVVVGNKPHAGMTESMLNWIEESDLLVEDLLLLQTTVSNAPSCEEMAFLADSTNLAAAYDFVSVATCPITKDRIFERLKEVFYRSKLATAMALDFGENEILSKNLAINYPEVLQDTVKMCGCLSHQTQSRKSGSKCESSGELKKSQLVPRLCLGTTATLPLPDLPESKPGLFEVLQRIDLNSVDLLLLCSNPFTIVPSKDISLYEIEELEFYEQIFFALVGALQAENNGCTTQPCGCI